MIRTVCFDIDNTMYDYTSSNSIAMLAIEKYGREKLGIEKEAFFSIYQQAQQQVKETLNQDCVALHNRLIRFQCMMENIGKTPYPYAWELYHIYWDTLLKQAVPEPGLQQFMKLLKEEGIRIGVGTDMTAHIQFKKLELLGVADYIDFIVTSEETGVEKPDPAFFKCCLKKVNCRPEECLFIGDNLKKDVLGAIASGMKALWYLGVEKGSEEECLKYSSIDSFTACIQEGKLDHDLLK